MDESLKVPCEGEECKDECEKRGNEINCFHVVVFRRQIYDIPVNKKNLFRVILDPNEFLIPRF